MRLSKAGTHSRNEKAKGEGHFKRDLSVLDGHKLLDARTTSSPLFFSQDQQSDETIEISIVASLLIILLLESEEARIETKK
jgi:hypothetical protein